MSDVKPTLRVDSTVSDLPEFAEAVLAFIANSPQVFGAADIFNVNFRNPWIRAGSLIAVLLQLVDPDGAPVVRKIVIVIPTESDPEQSKAAILEAANQAYGHFAKRELKSGESAWIKARLEVAVAGSRQRHSVLNLLSDQPQLTVVIVAEAASYRDEKTVPYKAPDAPAPQLAEDFWVPQVHAFARAVVELAIARRLYVVLDVDQPSPTRPALRYLLTTVEHCGVLGSENAGDPMVVLGAKVEEWNGLIADGRLGLVLRDIDNLPTLSSDQKKILRIQMLHQTRNYPQALQELRDYVAVNPKLDASTRVKLARIAQLASASALATAILRPCIDELNSAEDLEIGLITAHQIGSIELEDQVSARLEKLFPESEGLRTRRLRELAAARDYTGLSALYARQPEGQILSDFYQTLATSLSAPEVPDYQTLIVSAGDDVAKAEAYQTACVEDALARKLVVHAFRLAQPLPVTPNQFDRGEQLLLDSLREVLLYGKEGGQVLVSEEELLACLESLVERLGADASKTFLRFKLLELVQPTVSGLTGLSLLAVLLVRLASRKVQAVDRRFRGNTNMEWLFDHKPFLESAFNWLKEHEPVVIGRSVFPKQLLKQEPDDVVAAIIDYLERRPIESGEGLLDLQMYLALASTIAPHSSDPDIDLKLLQLVAGRLANAGNHQSARDLVEQALLNCGGTRRRRRLGWFAMADVYHRCHNYLTSLLAMSCALTADQEADREQIWEERLLLIRILRDCGLHEQARTAIGQAAEVLRQIELGDVYAHRLELVDLQIRYYDLLRRQTPRADLERLTQDLVRNAEIVLRKGDATEPTAIMLGQLLRRAKNGGVTLPPQADSVFQELCKSLSDSALQRIHAMSDAAPTAEDLLGLLKAGDAVRYADDVGYDMHNVAILAARVLDGNPSLVKAEDLSFALELLADRGVGLPNWDEAAVPAQAPKRVTESAEFACSLSKDGISVLQAGFDSEGRMVRVVAQDGALRSARESDDPAAESKFWRWCRKYPYEYGTERPTPDLFDVTTELLVLPTVPNEGPVLVVGDVGFQQFPPNLLRLRGGLAGRMSPMAAAPSLLWLKGALDRRASGDGRHCAWISTATKGEESQLLHIVHSQLESILDHYDFDTDNSPSLPQSFSGASMAVVSAHGEIQSDGRYFQVISNDEKLRVTSEDLANSLRNIQVVILFVCSGGRTDKHPQAITTLGMAKQILDRGCSAVVASPWPLDSQVPFHWLREFLKHWFQGERLIEANYAANQVVDQYFGNDPARGLAMSVYGNPMLRRQQSSP